MIVETYRNLNKVGHFSIRHKGKVIAHQTSAMLVDVKFIVQPSAQAKVQNGAPRSVHAWAKGTLIPLDVSTINTTHMTEVTYHPKSRADFYRVDNGETVKTAQTVILTNNKMYCIGVN